jgi:sugar-specific transcriptional regulator TrmB
MQTLLERELANIGLSEKAVRVYLASLELGPSPVQQISKKAAVNRPTAYVMIEALTEKGLMSSFEKGKKRFFKAENPEQLLSLVNQEKQSLETKEISIKKILPELKKLLSYSNDRPGVSFYEGIEGVVALRSDVLRSGEKELFELVPLDEVRKYISDDAPPDDLRHSIKRNLKIRSVYTSARGPVLKHSHTNVETRFIPASKIKLGCEVIIYGDKTALLTFAGKPIGAMIQSKEIAETMKSLFSFVWNEAEKGN